MKKISQTYTFGQEVYTLLSLLVPIQCLKMMEYDGYLKVSVVRITTRMYLVWDWCTITY